VGQPRHRGGAPARRPTLGWAPWRALRRSGAGAARARAADQTARARQVRGPSVITTLAISVAWIVYSMIPPLLLLWYTFIGRGTTLKLLCRRGPAAAGQQRRQACRLKLHNA